MFLALFSDAKKIKVGLLGRRVAFVSTFPPSQVLIA
jgi:hypothetical protein